VSVSPDHLPLRFHLEGTPWDRGLTLIADPAQPLWMVGRRALKALLPPTPANDTLTEEGPRPAYVFVTRSGYILRSECTGASYGLDPHNTLTLRRVVHRERGERKGTDTEDGRFTR